MPLSRGSRKQLELSLHRIIGLELYLTGEEVVSKEEAKILASALRARLLAIEAILYADDTQPDGEPPF